jgi:hypothetical protein
VNILGHFSSVCLFPCVLLFQLAPAVRAGVIDFEGFADSTVLTTQYTVSDGVTFSNAVIITAGISLNEFDFPTESGANVVSDYSGPISLAFSNPVFSFSGFFTYTEPLVVDAFDAGKHLVASAASAFSENFASCSGVGCNPSPDEFITVSSAAGISIVQLLGNPSGGSFTLDDATVSSSIQVSAPEPALFWLSLLLLLAPIGIKARRTAAFL